MGQCGFAAETSGVDHLLAYGLMAGGTWLVLIALHSLFDRFDGRIRDSSGRDRYERS